MDVITRARTHLVVTHLDYFTDTDAKGSEIQQENENTFRRRKNWVWLMVNLVVVMVKLQSYWEYGQNYLKIKTTQ